MEANAQTHILFLENLIRYHEGQIAQSSDNQAKQKHHFALMSSLRKTAEYIRIHANHPVPSSNKNENLEKDILIQNGKQTKKPSDTRALKVTQKKRARRNEPKFEIFRNKLLAHYQNNEGDLLETVTISENDFKFIIEAFDRETDSSGRIRWGAEALDDLRKSRSGIYDYKVQIVRRFLIQNNILEAGTTRTVYVVNKSVSLIQQGLNVWKKLVEMTKC